MGGIEPDGDIDLPAGHVAAITTYLEMRARPAELPPDDRTDLTLRQVERPDADAYRDIFRRVGSNWLWNSRLRLVDGALMALLCDPRVELYLPERDERVIGLLELDFRVAGEVEIAFFGLVPEAIGTSAGRWLMSATLGLAWRDGISRIWLHTCTLDHPDALDFYMRSGFMPYARKLTVFPDPRLSGLLPRNAAPQLPIIEG